MIYLQKNLKLLTIYSKRYFLPCVLWRYSNSTSPTYSSCWLCQLLLWLHKCGFSQKFSLGILFSSTLSPKVFSFFFYPAAFSLVPFSKFNYYSKHYWTFKTNCWPWLVWFSGLGIVPQTKRSPVWFPFRAHAWVVDQVPSWGYERGNQSMFLFAHQCFSPYLSPSFPLSLKINKYIFLKNTNCWITLQNILAAHQTQSVKIKPHHLS